MTDTPNTKPSEAAMELACGILGDWDVSYAAQVMTASMIDAALARAREEARKEALEEAADQVKCLISCVNAGPRNDGEEWYVVDTLEDAMSAIRALIHPTPQGETKEQQP